MAFSKKGGLSNEGILLELNKFDECEEVSDEGDYSESDDDGLGLLSVDEDDGEGSDNGPEETEEVYNEQELTPPPLITLPADVPPLPPPPEQDLSVTPPPPAEPPAEDPSLTPPPPAPAEPPAEDLSVTPPAPAPAEPPAEDPSLTPPPANTRPPPANRRRVQNRQQHISLNSGTGKLPISQLITVNRFLGIWKPVLRIRDDYPGS